ncbi:MAG: hypothetical protein KF865_03415 [Bdellovibrionaceae bacterium]|nr:hypothetical protein [Pseudobdellovibrionaceae bacterium]
MPSEIKVAFPYNRPAKFYEPTRIHLAPEYIFLENTYSPLVEVSPKDASLLPGVAESWKWDGEVLALKIRDNLKTVDGISITAKDAEFSLKRVLVRTGNTHGNFQSLVCGAAQIKTVNDDCEGLWIEGNTLFIKVMGKSAFILPMLSGIDFAIIPKSSVDPKTLDIIDYRNTSGPYYVETDNEEGKILLKRNPNHYRVSNDIPETIRLVPVDKANKTASLYLFEKGDVDFVTTIDGAKPEDVIAFSRNHSDSVLHSTANIRTVVLVFTERGLKELSDKERLLIGKKVKDALWPYFSTLPGYEVADQYFPSFSYGSLNEAMIQKLKAELPTGDLNLGGKHLKLTTVRVGDIAALRPLLEKAVSGIQVEEGANVPAFSKYEKSDDMPHVFIGGPDTGYHEDISLISYMLVSGTFGMTKEERASWLAKYMAIPEQEDRLKMLKEIHEESLRKGVLMPLASCPYVALAKKGWKIELSQLFANNPIWLVKRK